MNRVISNKMYEQFLSKIDEITDFNDKSALYTLLVCLIKYDIEYIRINERESSFSKRTMEWMEIQKRATKREYKKIFLYYQSKLTREQKKDSTFKQFKKECLKNYRQDHYFQINIMHMLYVLYDDFPRVKYTPGIGNIYTLVKIANSNNVYTYKDVLYGNFKCDYGGCLQCNNAVIFRKIKRDKIIEHKKQCLLLWTIRSSLYHDKVPCKYIDIELISDIYVYRTFYSID